MFVGHYGPAYFVKGVEKRIPLWVLFVAVQWVDILWTIFILLGIERVRIAPGYTAANPLGFSYYPYTHSLTAGVFWAVVVGGAYWVWRRRDGIGPALWVGGAVLSHWFLDLIVHVPDLGLIGNHYKVGLGLWRYPLLSLLAEAFVLLAGAVYYLRRTTPVGPAGRYAMSVFVLVMLAIQVSSAFGPPPPSTTAVAIVGLVTYVVFVGVVWRLERLRV